MEMTSLQKDAITLAKRNVAKLNISRRNEIKVVIRRKYFKEGFDIPRDCWEKRSTPLYEAIDEYYKSYNTDDIKTYLDTDLALNVGVLKKFAEEFPEYFI